MFTEMELSSQNPNINLPCLTPQPAPPMQPTTSSGQIQNHVHPLSTQQQPLPSFENVGFCEYQYDQGESQFSQFDQDKGQRPLPFQQQPSPSFERLGQGQFGQYLEEAALALLRILVQPSPDQHRFRYKCEGSSAGSILGATSTAQNKTYPKIKLEGFHGNATVRVSLVSKDAIGGRFSVHPHKLVGKNCKHGVLCVKIPQGTRTVEFTNLGIQCAKKKEVAENLKSMRRHNVDPFNMGFRHANSVDLNAVRLCFEVFLTIPGQQNEYALPPVVSEPIYDKKTKHDLEIVKLCSCQSRVEGGQEIILICQKVMKNDIQIEFFEMVDGKEVWQAIVKVDPRNVYHQTSISFRTPAYYNLELSEAVNVFIQLRRPSDQSTSEPRPFMFLPSEAHKRERQRLDVSQIAYLEENLLGARFADKRKRDVLEVAHSEANILGAYERKRQRIVSELTHSEENILPILGTSISNDDTNSVIPMNIPPVYQAVENINGIQSTQQPVVNDIFDLDSIDFAHLGIPNADNSGMLINIPPDYQGVQNIDGSTQQTVVDDIIDLVAKDIVNLGISKADNSSAAVAEGFEYIHGNQSTQQPSVVGEHSIDLMAGFDTNELHHILTNPVFQRNNNLLSENSINEKIIDQYGPAAGPDWKSN